MDIVAFSGSSTHESDGKVINILQTTLCIVFNLFVGIIFSCPFSRSLNNGHFSQQLIEEKKVQLVANDYRIDKGDPAYIIWGMFNYDNATRYLYNQSLAMVLAQQFYLEQYQHKHPRNEEFIVDDVLSEVQRLVARPDRCRAPPICDPDEQ